MGTTEEALSAVTPRHSVETLHRRKVLSRSWAALVISWSFIRTAIVWAAVGRYGLNPWIYLSIDLACSATDAGTTPRMVMAFIDDEYRSAVEWGLISFAVFIVPDVYIFLGTRTLPKTVMFIILGIILCTSAIAALSVVTKIRAGRDECLRRRVEAANV